MYNVILSQRITFLRFATFIDRNSTDPVSLLHVVCQRWRAAVQINLYTVDV